MSKYKFQCSRCGLVDGFLVKEQRTPFDIELSDAGDFPVMTLDLPKEPDYQVIQINNGTKFHFICAECGKNLYMTDDIIDSGKILKKLGVVVEVQE